MLLAAFSMNGISPRSRSFGCPNDRIASLSTRACLSDSNQQRNTRSLRKEYNSGPIILSAQAMTSRYAAFRLSAMAARIAAFSMFWEVGWHCSGMRRE
jgi:hypothetical protein